MVGEWVLIDIFFPGLKDYLAALDMVIEGFKSIGRDYVWAVPKRMMWLAAPSYSEGWES